MKSKGYLTVEKVFDESKGAYATMRQVFSMVQLAVPPHFPAVTSNLRLRLQLRLQDRSSLVAASKGLTSAYFRINDE